MQVNFTFSLKQEIEETKWIFSEFDFFVKNKYIVFYPKLSDSIKEKLINGSLDQGEEKAFQKEFAKIFDSEKNIYNETLDVVTDNWRKIEEEFFNILLKFKNTFHSKDITCFISRYGPGGSFYAPNQISVRVRKDLAQDTREANEKIAHEIVHLFIEPTADKYHLEFEDKERLVDLMLTKTPIAKLLDGPTMQGMGNEKLDDIFANNMYDLDKVVKQFKGL